MEALKNVNLNNVIWLDLESAREFEELSTDSPKFEAWAYTQRKSNRNITDAEVVESYKQEAALHAEFAKVVCIVVGRIKGDKLVTKRYFGSSESELLAEFNDDLAKMVAANPKTMIGTHAGKGFDIPFIAKRLYIHGIVPHSMLDVFNKKSWDRSLSMLLDTMEIWSGTSFRNSSLVSIAAAFNIPSPKDDITGAEVGEVYYTQGQAGLQRIVEYCERDVLTVANIVRKWKFEPLLELQSSTKVEIEKVPLIVSIANGGHFEKREMKELDALLAKVHPEDMEGALIVLGAIASKKESKLTDKYVTKLIEKYGKEV